MRYIYQRDGAPLVRWQGRNSAPSQTRAADAVSLGSLGDPTIVLPAPGAPEPLNGVSCKCGGSCGCSGGMGDADILDYVGYPGALVSGIVGYHPATPQEQRMVNVGITAGLAYLAYRMFKKR